MSRNVWLNNDGCPVRFRQGDTDTGLAKVSNNGAVKVAETLFSYDNLPTFTADNDGGGTMDIFTGGDVYIPANAQIVRAYVVCEEAWDGTETLDIGLYNKGSSGADSTAIDADGIFDGLDVDVDQAAVGQIVHCTGALISMWQYDGSNTGALDVTASNTSIGSADGYLVIAVATGSGSTTGKSRLVIEYLAQD